MDITAISDLHGYYPELEGGDLLIVAGDYTGNGSYNEYLYYCEWLRQQKYKCKIWIAGNHDNYLLKLGSPYKIISQEVIYLCDSGTEFEYERCIEGHWCTQTLKIWGSPWTKRFKGMNPKCMAFTVDTEEELAEKWKLIPDDIDILVTHTPPHGIMDYCKSINKMEHVGSEELAKVVKRIKPKICIFGHIHERYGEDADQWKLEGPITKYINCSYVNELYEPVNKPVRIIL